MKSIHTYQALFILVWFAMANQAFAQGGTSFKVTLLNGASPASGIRVLLNDPASGSIIGDTLTDANGIADFGNIGATRTTFSIVTTQTSTFPTRKVIQTFVNILADTFTLQAEIDANTLATFNVQLTNIPIGTTSTALFVAGGGGYGGGSNGFITNVRVTPPNIQPSDGKFSLTAEAMDSNNVVLGWGSLLDADPILVNGTTQSIDVSIPPLLVNFSANEPVAFGGGNLFRRGVVFDITLGEPHESTYDTSGTLKLCSIVGVEKIFLEAHTLSGKAFGTIFTVPPTPSSWQITLPNLSIDSLYRNGNTIGWTKSGTDLGKLDFAFPLLEWIIRGPSDSTQYEWELIGDPAQVTSFTLPDLPSDLADRIPPTAGVIVELLLGGLDSLTGFDDALQKISAANGDFDGVVLFNSTEFVGAQRSLEPITSVLADRDEIPTHYNLGQNYPNPFNPSTTIRFDLPKTSYVTLKIFNLLGQEVATVVSEELKPGTYEVTWNASGLSSGVYFYRLTAGGYLENKKLVLLK